MSGATHRCPRCLGTGVERLTVDRADEPVTGFATRYDGVQVTCPNCEGECEVAKTECEGCGRSPVVGLSDDGLFALCDCCISVGASEGRAA